MKKCSTRVALVVAVISLVSCVSGPAPKEDPKPSPQAETPGTATSAEDTAANAEPAASQTETGQPPAGTQDVSVSAPSGEKPAEAANPPSVPAGERFLPVYPEPETLVIVPPPAEKAVATEKPAPTAKVPVPEKPVATEKATEKPAPKKTDKETKPAEKAAEKPAEKPSDGKADKAAAEILPGIWESEPVAPNVPAVAEKPAIVPSRKATVAVGQTLEVWYPATGWVYLGDASAQNGLGYQTRKMDKKDTLFTFKAQKAGNYILEFSRYDVLSDGFTADSLSVEVTETGTGRQDKVRAPDYRAGDLPAVQPAPTAQQGVPAATSVATDEPSLLMSQPIAAGQSPAAVTPQALLDKARAALASGDAASALTQLDAFFGVATDSLDEGWFLRGQAYEANTPNRDMKKAMSAYETLIAAYPDSVHWKESDARVRYIRQFYLRIR